MSAPTGRRSLSRYLLQWRAGSADYRSHCRILALLLAVVAQQLGVFAHTSMLARAALGGSVFGEICTSVVAGQRARNTDPADPSPGQPRSCDLCSAATAASLHTTCVNLVAAAPTIDDAPAILPRFPLESTVRPAYLSRAPPRLPSA